MCLNAEPWHVIDKSLYGLPGIAFGGYVGGLLAAELDGDTKVDFHAPTPLKTQLEIRRGHGRVDVFAADVLVATARPHRLDLEPPRLPDWDEACRAVDEYLQKAPITHPDCFGCGPDRRSDSGLRIFTGLTEPGDLVAAAWQPPADFGGRRGEHLPLEFVWSALDCPGAWARRRIVQSDRRALTAYLAAAITRPVRVDEPHVVIGWLQSASGRKSLVGSAIVNKHQEVCAIAEALWVERSLSQASPGHDLTAANHVDDSSLTTERNPR